jgi:hypothetical protein
MVNQIALLLVLSFWPAPFNLSEPAKQTGAQERPPWSTKVAGTYDAEKDETTVRLAPVKISGSRGKYVSVHMSPSFKFPGRSLMEPEIVDFELQTVVRGRLSTDLYVVFIIDGISFFFSSNRWAIKRPVPGRVWAGERLVFRMPYQTYVNIANAKTLVIKFDGLRFPVGKTQREALRELLNIT